MVKKLSRISNQSTFQSVDEGAGLSFESITPADGVQELLPLLFVLNYGLKSEILSVLLQILP